MPARFTEIKITTRLNSLISQYFFTTTIHDDVRSSFPFLRQFT